MITLLYMNTYKIQNPLRGKANESEKLKTGVEIYNNRNWL